MYIFSICCHDRKKGNSIWNNLFLKLKKQFCYRFLLAILPINICTGSPRYLRELRPTKDARIPKPRITREHFHDVSMLKIVQKPRLSDGKYQFAISKFRYQIVNHELSKPQILKTNIMSISF